MKIFTHPNLYQVVNIQNVLQMHSIQTRVEHEFLAAGAGELAPVDVWPELWLVDPNDAELATKWIAEAKEDINEEWHCGQCGETNGGSFEICWQCQSEPKSA